MSWAKLSCRNPAIFQDEHFESYLIVIGQIYHDIRLINLNYFIMISV